MKNNYNKMKHVKQFNENIITQQTPKIASVFSKEEAEVLIKWLELDQKNPGQNNSNELIKLRDVIVKAFPGNEPNKTRWSI